MQGTGAPQGLGEETGTPQNHASTPTLSSGAERTVVFLVPLALVLAVLAALSGSGLAEAPPAMVVAAVADDTTRDTAEPHGPPPTTLPQLTTQSSPSSSVTTATTLTTQTPTTQTLGTQTLETSAPATTTTTVPTTIPPTTARPEDVARARGEQALALISYDWRQKLPGWTISFHPGRSGVLGYTFVNERRIEVYVRTEQPNTLLAHVVAHELGHAVDVTLNNGDDRRVWQQARGIGDRPWWPGSGVTDFSTGAGDFAESFAAWQVGDGSFRSKLSAAPTNEQISVMATLADG